MSANRWPGLPDTTASQIEAALARGQKIEAIKLFREATNCGLKEAKDAIEQGGRVTIAGQITRPNFGLANWIVTLIVIASVIALILFVMVIATE